MRRVYSTALRKGGALLVLGGLSLCSRGMSQRSLSTLAQAVAAQTPATSATATPPPAGDKSAPDWPAAPEKIASPAESRAAAPVWWRALSNGVIAPQSRHASRFFAEYLEQRKVNGPPGGLLCELSSKKSDDDEGTSRLDLTVLDSSERLTFTAERTAVFVPGLEPQKVRRIEARRFLFHSPSFGQVLLGLVAVVPLPFIATSYKNYVIAASTTRLASPPPWEFSSSALAVDCALVPRHLVEKYIAAQLAELPACLDKSVESAGIVQSDPALTCLGDLVGLTGWSDPRAVEARQRFDRLVE